MNSASFANKKTPAIIAGVLFQIVPKTRVELARANAHHPLKVACLPIPPPGLICGCKNTTFFISFYKMIKIFFVCNFIYKLLINNEL